MELTAVIIITLKICFQLLPSVSRLAHTISLMMPNFSLSVRETKSDMFSYVSKRTVSCATNLLVAGIVRDIVQHG